MKIPLNTDFRTSPPKVFRRKPGGNYYFRERIMGRDVWRSLKTKNKRDAEALAYKIWFSHQKDGLKNIIEMPDLPLEFAWDTYIKSEKYIYLADSTKKMRLKDYNHFRTWMHNSNIHSINQLTHELITLYLSASNTNKTFNNKLNALRQVFKRVYDIMDFTNPFDKIEAKSTSRGPKASQEFRAFSDIEISQIFEQLRISNLKNKQEWITACKIALNTGLRYKDIAMLQWHNIKKDNIIELVPHKTENKTGKAVLIPMSDNLKNIINALPKKSFYVLPGLAESYNVKSTWQFIRQLNKLNFTGKVGFHSFRATFVTWARSAGVDPESVAGVVGHSSIAQTEYYNKSAKTVDLSFLDNKNILKSS